MAAQQGIVVFVIHRQGERLEPLVGFLLAEEATEGSVATGVAIGSLLAFKSTAVFFKLVVLTLVLLEMVINLLSVDVELAKLVHVVHHLVAHLYSLSCLL